MRRTRRSPVNDVPVQPLSGTMYVASLGKVIHKLVKAENEATAEDGARARASEQHSLA